MSNTAGYLLILGTVCFTVYGQCVLKWQVGSAGDLPADLAGKVAYVGLLLRNPWVLSGLAAAFMAFLFWLIALSKFDLSYAYPFTSLSFVFVVLLSALLFREALTVGRVVGLLLIVLGLVVGSRS